MSSATFIVRRPDDPFDQFPRYFFDNNPLMSALLSALSLTFPEGERLFVHSVRNVRHLIQDEHLQKDVAAFIGQEAMHSQAHTRFNLRLATLGLETEKILDEEKRAALWAKKNLSQAQQLAITCALEHFTAILAKYILEHQDFQDKFDPSVRQLWLWHALEETEHKAVAFDVFQTVFHDTKVRKRFMVITTCTFLTRISFLTLRLLAQDPQGRFAFKQHLQGLSTIRSIVKSLATDYSAYYAQDFHPNTFDTTALTAKWSQHFAEFA